MLKKLSREPPRQSTSETQPIPDPWELSPTPIANRIPEAWTFPLDTHPLIRPAGNLQAPQLPGYSPIPPIQVLLQDELKLGAHEGGKLKEQMKKALALLCWVETVEPARSD